MLHLTDAERTYVLDGFVKGATSTAHSAVWRRRSYAPMYVYREELARVREAVEWSFPEYVIAFDVVFESAGARVAWHCDYESLGPFEVPDRWRAMTGNHFLTVHFNLTPDGGSLTTANLPLLSYAFYLCISTFGIFSLAHRVLLAVCAPVLWATRRVHPNAVGAGNVFDNTRLHAVTAGAPRVSYVLRLVRASEVRLTRRSVSDGISRWSACEAFSPLLHVVGADERLDAGAVPWAKALGRERGGETK